MLRSMGLALVASFLLIGPLPCFAQSPITAPVMSKQKAVVLGGGGEDGEAWESGVIAGLAEKGVDLSRADMIIGTSAGAIVGARLAIGTPADLMKAILNPPEGPLPAQKSSSGPEPDLPTLARKFKEMNSGQRPPQQVRAESGAWGLKAPPITTEYDFLASYLRRFPDPRWPERAFECTAVDTADGSLKLWNKDSRVPLIYGRRNAIRKQCRSREGLPNDRGNRGGARAYGRCNQQTLRRSRRRVVVAAHIGKRTEDVARRRL
jgi:hypothetical protein